MKKKLWGMKEDHKKMAAFFTAKRLATWLDGEDLKKTAAFITDTSLMLRPPGLYFLRFHYLILAHNTSRLNGGQKLTFQPEEQDEHNAVFVSQTPF
jgi:hypothetical protein